MLRFGALGALCLAAGCAAAPAHEPVAPPVIEVGVDTKLPEPTADDDADAEALASQLAALDVEILRTLGEAGVPAGVLSTSEVPADLLDAAARSGGTGRSGTGSGALPQAAGGTSSPKQIGGGAAATTGGPGANVVLGGAGVSGATVANAAAVVARMRGRFLRCYTVGLQSHPGLTGSAVLVAELGPNGEVLSVSAGSGSLAPVLPCLRAVVESGAFSPPAGGAARIHIPITLTTR